jgi:hypothetical protein
VQGQQIQVALSGQDSDPMALFCENPMIPTIMPIPAMPNRSLFMMNDPLVNTSVNYM